MQDGSGRSCIATLLYCERGACGPGGACCSSTFLSVSSTPPEVGGATGVAPPGWDCAAARHEAGAAAHAEAAAFGFLQQHGADQHRYDHEVNDDNDGLHLKNLPSQADSAGLRLHQELVGFPEVARCYTIGPGIVTPIRSPRDNCRRRHGKAVPSFRRRPNPDLRRHQFLL
jgi:hypothetical protein